MQSTAGDRRGWWGRQIVDGRVIQKGSPRRLRTIFNTNLRTSYAAGRWDRIQRTKEDLPFLRYVAVRDAATRPDHLAWHGTVLPVDDPFWRSHYPPNGWNCRCSVVQFSERQLKTRGYEVSEGPPAGWDRTRVWENPRTEDKLNVPVGIDPGWGHNTGVLRSQVKADRLVARLEEPGVPEGLARAMVQEGLEDPAFLSFMTGAVPGDWPVGVVPQKVLGAIGGRKRTLRLSQDGVKSHPRYQDFETGDWLRVQEIVDEGRVFKDGPQSAIFFFEEDGKFWAEAIKATRDGEKTFMASLHRAERNLDEIAR